MITILINCLFFDVVLDILQTTKSRNSLEEIELPSKDKNYLFSSLNSFEFYENSQGFEFPALKCLSVTAPMIVSFANEDKMGD